MALRARFLPVLAILLLAALLTACERPPPVEGGPIAIRRLTEDQYRQSVADIFGPDIKVVGRFEPISRREGLLAVGASVVSVTPAGFEQYDAMARGIAAQVVDGKHRQALLPCAPKSPSAADDACTRRVVEKYGRLLFRRPLKEDEVAPRVRLAADATTTLGDWYGGLEFALASLLSAPEFLFRVERLAREAPGGAPAHVDGYTKAARLSYFLWNTTPDEELLAAAARGELDDRAGLERQVDRMLASPRIEAGARAFFSDLLRFDAFDELSKDASIYPVFSAKLMADAREQTLRVVTDHLVARQQDYRDLFTTRHSFMTRTLGMLYGVPVRTRDGWEPYEFPPDSPRAGLLSQASFAALYSHPGRSSPTLRGKAVREVLMCQRVPDPPSNVDFSKFNAAESARTSTARDRLTAHNVESACVGCHKLTDPVGLGFEQFDGVGAYRVREGGSPIDPSGVLDGVAFRDAVELGRAMHDNPQVPACLVRNVYQYATGRPATKREEPYLQYLARSFAAEGYRWRALLERVATSEAFYAVAPSTGGTKPATATTSTKSPGRIPEKAS